MLKRKEMYVYIPKTKRLYTASLIKRDKKPKMKNKRNVIKWQQKSLYVQANIKTANKSKINLKQSLQLANIHLHRVGVWLTGERFALRNQKGPSLRPVPSYVQSFLQWSPG